MTRHKRAYRMRDAFGTRLWLAWQMLRSRPISFRYDAPDDFEPTLTVVFAHDADLERRLWRNA
jgi:hypothetical protein